MFCFPKLDEALEIFLTLHELKPVSRIVVSESKLKEINEFCSNIGLYFAVSSFKIVNKTCIIDKESDVSGSFFVYFSKDENKALEAKEAEEDFDDKKVGELFGYPECCREFYVTNYKEAKDYGDDFAPITHRNSTSFSYYTNNLMRFFGFALISHFPCKHNCMESIKLGKTAYNLISKENPEFAFELKKKLMNLVFFDKKTGVLGFDTTQTTGEFISYKKTLFIAANENYNFFNSGNNVLLGKKKIKVFKNEKLIHEYDKNERLLAFEFT